jgi:hypothetical protein
MRLPDPGVNAGAPTGTGKAETLNELTPDVLLDGIDGLQTQVATCRDGGGNRPWLRQEAAQAAEALWKTGGAKGMTTPRARFGDMAAYSLRVRAVVVE